MKKLLFAICAVAALASCSKEEVVSYDKGEVIGFANPFVNKSTRVEYDNGTNKVQSFKVYGIVTPQATGEVTQIYNGNNVTRGTKADGEAWACEGTTQYWLPSSNYSFAAIVDGAAVATSALPVTIKHTVVDGSANNKDLLYAKKDVVTNNIATPTGVNASGVVEFDFSHILSKMQFTIVNATNQTYKVTGISVTGFTNNGVYTVAGGTWAKDAGAADNVELTFGETTNIAGGVWTTATETRQFLPVAQTLQVTIEYDVIDEDGTTVVGSLTKTGTIIEKTYVKNTRYNVTATLTANEIQFTLGTVEGWSDDNTITL